MARPRRRGEQPLGPDRLLAQASGRDARALRLDRDRAARRLSVRRRKVEPLRRARREEREEAAPSIAVLPFENLSQDVEQQYFADGLAEDIITRLSRLRWLFVSARNSSFTFRGALDVREIGRVLGVRYVLNGSVRRSGQRLRIGAQLSDASTGGQVWASATTSNSPTSSPFRTRSRAASPRRSSLRCSRPSNCASRAGGQRASTLGDTL